MRSSLTFIFSIFSYLCISINAQTDIVFSSIDSKNGLSDNRIRNITQLSDGRMMILTEGVTNIYDGTKFTQLHLKKDCIYPLSGYTGFHHSYVDQKYVWIKNLRQLYLFDTKSGNYISNPKNIFKQLGVKDEVADVFIDLNENYWIKTQSDQLLYYKHKNKSLEVFCKNISYPEGQKDELLDVVVIKSRVYLFYGNGLMLCYSIENGKFIYKTNSLDIPERQMYNHSLLIFQKDNFLYLLRNNIRGIMQAFNTDNNQWTTVLKTDYWLNTISIDKDQNIWVSCKEGLWRIDKSFSNKKLVSTFNLIDGKDVTNEVSTLYTDAQGGFWVGTLNHGILYFHPDRFKFKNINQNGFDNLKKDIIVYTISEYKSDIYIFCTNKGIYFYNSKTGKISPAPLQIRNLICFKIIKLNEGMILHTSSGFFVFSESSSSLKKISDSNSLVTFMYDQNHLFTCNRLCNCCLYDLNKNNTECFETNKNDVSSKIWPQKLLLLNSSSVAGIDNHTFFIYNFRTGKISFPLANIEKSTQITYTDIFRDKNGLFWFGTTDGLLVFDAQRNKNKMLYTEDGLINSSVKAICEDKNNNIWLTTSGGISRINAYKTTTDFEFRISNFNWLDGVITNEFIEKSIYLSQNNVLLSGGVNGINIIDLNRPWRLKKLQKPIFTSLLLNGNEIRQGISYDNNCILLQVVSETDTITLKHNQNFISLSFSALNFVNPTQTYYRYKLYGVDIDWHEISSNNGTGMANYTDLSPGTYTFEVYSANNSKEWSDKAATITVIIKPPFWKTTIAYILYLVILFYSIYKLVSYFRIRTQRLLSQKNEEKLNQMKFRFFTNISHEFRTPLTLVITPLESILKDAKGLAFESRLESVYRNAQQLLLLVNQLLDFRRLESGGEKLKLSFGNLSDFITQFEITFGKVAAERQILFHIVVPEKDLFIYFDSDKLTKIINNLLSNAFKHTPNGGSITINVRERNEVVEISVTDNGKGIDSKDLPFIFNRFYQSDNSKQGSGIGLHLVSEYVKLHGGEIQVKSTMGEGSTFTVLLPIQEESCSFKDEEIISNDLNTTHTEFIEKLHSVVLVVEDNDELRHFLVSELSTTYTLLEAKNGLEGLRIASAEMPDLIISDVLMPHMDGIEMCKKIKSDVNTSHIPVILLTAKAADEHRMDGYHAGADEYLTKPFNLDMLKLRANNLIENRLIRQKNFSEKIEINPGEIAITSIDQQFIIKTLDLIEKNMANGNYSVQQLSNDLCMDRTVLYKKIQSITGLAPLEFMRSIRLKRAAQLLEKGGLPVAEVALMTGFNTQKYFTKYFRETFGVNPSHYSSRENKTE